MKSAVDGSTHEFTSPADCVERVREFVSERNILSALSALEAGKNRFRNLFDRPDAQLLAGKVARWRERYKEARQWFRRSAQHTPSKLESTYELGRVWLEAGRLELAVDALLSVGEDPSGLIPYRAHAWSGLCVCYAGLERRQSAENAIKRAAQFGIVSAQLLADEARFLAAGGALEEAQAQLARAIQIDTGCVDAFELLANLFHINGRSSEAKEILAYGIEHSPHSLKLMAMMGEVHYSVGEHKEAAAFYRRCLEISPEGANADPTRLNFARALHGCGRNALAVKELEALLERHPRSIYRREARERLRSLGGKARAKHMIEHFPRKLQKKNYCAPNTLANMLAYFGENQSQDRIAEEVFTRGTRWNDLLRFLRRQKGFTTYAFLTDADQLKTILDDDIPVIVGEYSGLDGHCIAMIGYDDHMGVFVAQDPLFYDPVEIPYQEFRESWAFTDNLAVVCLPDERAASFDLVERDGEEIVAQWLSALDLRDNGAVDEADAALRSIVEREAEFASAWRTRVEIAMAGEDNESAFGMIEELLERKETGYWVLRYAGDLAMMRNDYVEALGFYARAVRIFPNDPTLHYMRAEIALYAGDRKRGRAELVKALEAQPDSIPPRIRLSLDYLDAGDLYRARYHMQAAQELEPEHPALVSLSERIERASAAASRA